MGIAVFERLRRKRKARHVFLYAFDLLELSRCRAAEQHDELAGFHSTCTNCARRAAQRL
jgi:hypothetical protein